MSETDIPPSTSGKPAVRKTRKTAGKTVTARKPKAKGKAPEAKATTAATEAANPVSTVSGSPVPLFRVPMAVRWRDLDAFNHVNNSKYLSYLEEARLHWMIGVPGKGLDDHVAPVVAAAQLNYRRPIGWPAQVVIELFVERLGNTSLTIGHRIVDATDAGVLYCDGHVVMVWIDRDSGVAAALPDPVREACSRP